ncbi:MAG TPA: signal peptide peptidase SppA [Methanothermococcus okinawensis]|uniref:Signal peptide peptidase SppA n=1 Tax=Methanothermococcus okinawensis TaxID=155863 RepID=A0A832ZYM7_9EURY|nr:signal peptide peptidase SppA [Methanothermococcus okinawensis]
MSRRNIVIGIGLVIGLLIILSIGGAILLLAAGGISTGNIARIDIEGILILHPQDKGLFTETLGVEDYIEALDRAEKDPTIKAIILRVNSPGGEVIASEKLARKVKEVAEKKPVVAYVETMGTSGAYMAIAPATCIVAEKHAIVGGIGVRLDMIQYYELMRKVGVNVTVIKAGKYKDMGSPYRPLTPEEKEYLEGIVKEIYMDFVKWVAENRNMTVEEALKVADGKIYSGEGAKRVGLVDYVGTEEDAVEMAQKLANISSPEIVDYTPSKYPGLFNLMSQLTYTLGYGIGRGLSERWMETYTLCPPNT